MEAGTNSALYRITLKGEKGLTLTQSRKKGLTQPISVSIFIPWCVFLYSPYPEEMYIPFRRQETATWTGVSLSSLFGHRPPPLHVPTRERSEPLFSIWWFLSPEQVLVDDYFPFDGDYAFAKCRRKDQVHQSFRVSFPTSFLALSFPSTHVWCVGVGAGRT